MLERELKGRFTTCIYFNKILYNYLANPRYHLYGSKYIYVWKGQELYYMAIKD